MCEDTSLANDFVIIQEKKEEQKFNSLSNKWVYIRLSKGKKKGLLVLSNKEELRMVHPMGALKKSNCCRSDARSALGMGWPIDTHKVIPSR